MRQRARCPLALALLALTGTSISAAGATLQFEPATPAQARAAHDYAEIWRVHGARISATLEAHACASLPTAPIRVVVAEAPSHSGNGRAPMRLRASYPEPLKRGTLVHEMGHRLIPARALRATGYSEHQALDLLLLQVWEDLWGADFVPGQVAAESRWSPAYRDAWQWAMALTPAQRQVAWRAVLQAGGREPSCRKVPRD